MAAYEAYTAARDRVYDSITGDMEDQTDIAVRYGDSVLGMNKYLIVRYAMRYHNLPLFKEYLHLLDRDEADYTVRRGYSFDRCCDVHRQIMADMLDHAKAIHGVDSDDIVAEYEAQWELRVQHMGGR